MKPRTRRAVGPDLAGMVSHELRTPLAAIVGGLEVVLDGDAGDLTAPLRGRLEAVDRNARRLQGAVCDLLYLVAPRGGRPARREPVDLRAIMQRAADQLRTYRPAATGTLLLELPGEPVRAHGDPVELERMVLNLLTAGVLSTRPGATVTAAVGAERQRARIRVHGGPGHRPAALGGFELLVAGCIARRHGGALLGGNWSVQGASVSVVLPARLRQNR